MNILKLISFLLLLSFNTGAFAEDKFALSQTVTTSSEKINITDLWVLNAISRFLAKARSDEISDQADVEQEKRMFNSAKLIAIDTRGQNACISIKKERISDSALSSGELEYLCEFDRNLYSTVVMNGENEFRKPVVFENLTQEESKILEETRDFSVLGVGMIGLIWMLPERMSKWDHSEMGQLGDKYLDNVGKGVVVDKDDWEVNYIGHPVAGAAYYRVGRHAGLSKWQSFTYSLFMSTIVWEYGLEAVAEVPSIQDLLVTPVVGSLMGELFIDWEKNILENEGKFLGSKDLGSIAMVLMDPARGLLDGVNKIFNNEFVKESRIFLFSKSYREESSLFQSDYVGVGFELRF